MTEIRKQIVLYKSGSGILNDDLKALREAGFIPIRVKNLADVKVLDPLSESTDRGILLTAAMTAIAKANKDTGPRTMFGQLLAEKLMALDVPKSGN